jgi:hypothetical protein
LVAAGMAVEAEDTCRYPAQSATQPWHLNVRLTVEAPPARVAVVLEAEGIVVRGDREPMVVQQFPGNPRDGWNGALDWEGDHSVLGLTYNNATPSRSAAAIGWAEVCR